MGTTVEDRILEDLDDDLWPDVRPMVMIVPCGSEKLDRPVPARDLYTSTMFRLAWDAATAEVDAYDGPARILILSALHGLIDPSTVIGPYDVKMSDSGSVTPDQVRDQAVALGMRWSDEVYGLLPNSYFSVLDEALRQIDVYAQPVYEATSGIGDQRHVCRVVRDLP